MNGLMFVTFNISAAIYTVGYARAKKGTKIKNFIGWMAFIHIFASILSLVSGI